MGAIWPVIAMPEAMGGGAERPEFWVCVRGPAWVKAGPPGPVRSWRGGGRGGVFAELQVVLPSPRRDRHEGDFD